MRKPVSWAASGLAAAMALNLCACLRPTTGPTPITPSGPLPPAPVSSMTAPMQPLQMKFHAPNSMAAPGESLEVEFRLSTTVEGAVFTAHIVPSGNVCLQSPTKVQLPAMSRSAEVPLKLRFVTAGPGTGSVRVIVQARSESGALFLTNEREIPVGSWDEGTWLGASNLSSSWNSIEQERALWLAAERRVTLGQYEKLMKDLRQGKTTLPALTAPCSGAGGLTANLTAKAITPALHASYSPNFAPVAWRPDSGALLYGEPVYPGPGEPWLMRVDLSRSDIPSRVSDHRAAQATWTPDGQIITVGPRETRPGPSTTILLAGADGPIDLVSPPVQDASGYMFQDWIDPNTLAFTAGTRSEFFLLDVKQRTVTEMQFPVFSDPQGNSDGSLIAGQRERSPARFGVWDRRSSNPITLPQDLPGKSQWFEAWLDDGESLLFTAWDQTGPYRTPTGERLQPTYPLAAASTLYKLHIGTGEVQKIADHAAFAATSGNTIAYLKLDQRLTLEVESGDQRWSEDLGEAGPGALRNFVDYRPVLAGTYVAYRTAADEWRVSPIARNEPRTVYSGAGVQLFWSPDGSHAALITTTQPNATLLVLRNPHLQK